MADADSGTPPESGGGSFLRRWSRRKQRVRPAGEAAEGEGASVAGTGSSGIAPSPSSVPATVADGVAQPLPSGAVPEPSTTRLPAHNAAGPAAAERPPLPELESLTDDSDVSAFLDPEVDGLIRRAALRRVFLSPAFNVVDGLDDYDDDFTRFEPLGDIVTSDMRHQAEREADAHQANSGADPEPASDEQAALEQEARRHETHTASHEADEVAPVSEPVSEQDADDSPCAESEGRTGLSVGGHADGREPPQADSIPAPRLTGVNSEADRGSERPVLDGAAGHSEWRSDEPHENKEESDAVRASATTSTALPVPPESS